MHHVTALSVGTPSRYLKGCAGREKDLLLSLLKLRQVLDGLAMLRIDHEEYGHPIAVRAVCITLTLFD
jgi:hypothetical protein